ncbi:MAG: class I SAM-dependent methyltransferase [Burkholderiales bacterium]|nr:class I SAM-dependent methyltransferase [Burkholderiales bacterium]
MTSLTCPICAAPSYPFETYTDFFGNPVSLHKCINCGHGSHDRQYTAEQFSEMYRADYAADYLVKEKALYQQRQVQYALDVGLLLASRQFGDVRVLDYGCSSGGYLDAMPGTWAKCGFEVNPFHIEYIRANKPHIAVFDSPAAVEGQFDVITLRGVIEHIPDHADLLDFLGARLAPGGSVFITATPDFSSVCATLYKSRWNQVTCPEHIHQFSTASLALLLARAGLVLRSLNHPYMDTPYARWEQDREQFMANFRRLRGDPAALIEPAHAFPGNMISALFEKGGAA